MDVATTGHRRSSERGLALGRPTHWGQGANNALHVVGGFTQLALADGAIDASATFPGRGGRSASRVALEAARICADAGHPVTLASSDADTVVTPVYHRVQSDLRVGMVMPQVTAMWIERFAARLIQLHPETNPLDAVRSATVAYPSVAELTPEDAATVFVAPCTRGQLASLSMSQAPVLH